MSFGSNIHCTIMSGCSSSPTIVDNFRDRSGEDFCVGMVYVHVLIQANKQ